MRLPTLHALGIPHTITSKEYLACAFTQKVYNHCPMLTNLCWNVIHYGNEASTVPCTEHVTVTTKDDLKKTYGDIDYWKTQQFIHNRNSHIYKTYYENTIREVRKRAKKDDLILCFFGTGHKPVADALTDLPVHIVEPGIGYPRTFAPHRVFESSAKQAFVAGQRHERHLLQQQYKNKIPEIAAWDPTDVEPYTVPKWTDAVIPNYFNPDEFEGSDEKEDYFLFVGRIQRSKGIEIAMHVANYFQKRLVVAGQGDFKTNLDIEPYPIVDCVGTVGVEGRKQLMSKAKIGFAPSLYREPFCGAHIEYAFSELPSLVTNWGVFHETIKQEKYGYRCTSYNDFIWAAEHIDRINSHECRDWAIRNFSMDRVSLMYDQYYRHVVRHANAQHFWYLNQDRDDEDGLSWLNQEMTYEEIQAGILRARERNQLCMN